MADKNPGLDKRTDRNSKKASGSKSNKSSKSAKAKEQKIHIHVIIEEKAVDEELACKAGTEVGSLAFSYGYSLQEVMFKVNGSIVPDDYICRDGDNVEIVRVVYAG